MKHGYLDLHDVRLHYVEAGKGPLVILLHGFPDCWETWKHQMTFLASKGYHVVAPDMRGYHRSSKPKGVASYHIKKLVGDVEAVIKHFGKKAIVVGHDWGGNVSWYTAMYASKVVRKLIVLNCPHPSQMGMIWKHPVQWLRSAYIWFFQLPVVPEMLLTLFWPGMKVISGIPKEVDAFDHEVEFTPAINYYRSWIRNLLAGKLPLKVISIPVHLIWGVRDRYLGKEIALPPKKWVPHLHFHFLRAGHWVHHQKRKAVNELLLAALK